jgi:hypothetical protein
MSRTKILGLFGIKYISLCKLCFDYVIQIDIWWLMSAQHHLSLRVNCPLFLDVWN